MLRSILIALDETAASTAAQQFAIDLAKRFGAEITGLAVLDRVHIAAPTAVGIGGFAYKEHRDQVKLEQARAFLVQLEQRFRSSCEAGGVEWQVVEVEGVPYQLMEQESGRHDLVVIGKDTDFHFDDNPVIADMVQRLLRDNPRPLVVCPKTVPSGDTVLAATDGSLHSMRALHMLALLGDRTESAVHVLAIAHDGDEAERRAHYAGELFAKHGFEVEARGVASRLDPAEIITEAADKLDAHLIAVGASGHSAWHDLFLGSTTKRLLEFCPRPLFLYH